MSSRLLLPLILLLPLAEIAMFVLVGQRIGVGATILTVLASSFCGLILMRRQGISMLRGLQAGSTGAEGGEVVRGMLHMVSGLLLVIPGFITSALGLLLLLPLTRSFLWRSLKPDVVVTRSAQFYRRSNTGERNTKSGASVIDLDDAEFQRNDETEANDGAGQNRSPWAGPGKQIDG